MRFAVHTLVHLRVLQNQQFLYESHVNFESSNRPSIDKRIKRQSSRCLIDVRASSAYKIEYNSCDNRPSGNVHIT